MALPNWNVQTCWDERDKEWARLQTLAEQVTPDMDGPNRFNFLVAPYDAPVNRGGSVFVRATVLDVHDGISADIPWSSGRSNKALLKIRLPDWELYRLMKGPLKVLNVGVTWVGAWILDCTPSEAVVVSAAKLEQGTCLHVAEFFSGAFMGWSHAAWMLHRMRVPISVTWGLDNNPQCVEAQRRQHDTAVVYHADQLFQSEVQQSPCISLTGGCVFLHRGLRT